MAKLPATWKAFGFSRRPSADELSEVKRTVLNWSVLLITALVAFYHFSFKITAPGLWNDEGYSYLLAKLPFHSLLQATREYYFAPPLWYLIEKLSLLCDTNPWILRLPSLLASIASACLLLLFGRLFFDQARKTVLAPLLFLVSPMAFYYAQEARNYALLGTLFLIAAITTEKLSRRPDRWLGACYIVALLGCMLLHNYSILLWMTLNLYLILALLHNGKWQNLSPWINLQGVVLLLTLPWLPRLFSSTANLEQLVVLEHLWDGQYWWSAVWSAFRNMTPGDQGLCFLPIGQAPILGLLATIASLVSIVDSKIWGTPLLAIRLLLLPLFPIMLIAYFSDVIHPAYFNGRSEAMTLPIYCGVILFFILHGKRRYLTLTTLALLTISGVWAIYHNHYRSDLAETLRHRDRQVAATVAQQNPTWIVVDGHVSAAVIAHLMDLGLESRILLFPNIDLSPKHALPEKFLRQSGKTKVQRDHLLPSYRHLLDSFATTPNANIAVISGRSARGIGLVTTGPGKWLITELNANPQFRQENLQSFRWDYMRKWHDVVLYKNVRR